MVLGPDGGNPQAKGRRVRVSDPFAAFQNQFKDLHEVWQNGFVQIPINEDVTTIRAAELYLEVWGGHPGTSNKRVTVNGRTTYSLPENGTHLRQCTHLYPSLPLRITDLVRGYNALQFACDKGVSFWGHFIVDEACLRTELPVGHVALAAAARADFSARVRAETVGEVITLSLATEGTGGDDIASVEFHGCYEGYDENGSGEERGWHGFTRQREVIGHLGTVTTAPFALVWDVSMLPAQEHVAVRAVVRFKSTPELIYRTPLNDQLKISPRSDVEVAVFGVKDLPAPFWSRANRPGSAVIMLPMNPATIERAELHSVSWTGGPGEVKEYFQLNDHHFPVAEGSDHRSHYTVFPVDRHLLRTGENTIEIRSDTQHHGIEMLTPGPALLIRYRKS